MTGTSRPDVRLLASDDVDVRGCESEARAWHDLYREHVESARHCVCATGGLCPRGRLLQLEADDAGIRVELAKRARGGRG